MGKIKINPNFASLMILVSLFAGWTYLVWVLLFVFLLMEDNEFIKKMAISVVALLAACMLVEYGWDLIEGLIYFVKDAIYGIFDIILVIDKTVKTPEFIITIFENIIPIITKIIGSLISLLILFTKLSFILNTLANKQNKNFMGPVNKYLELVTKFVLEKIDGNNIHSQSNNAQQVVNQNQVNNPQQTVNNNKNNYWM